MATRDYTGAGIIVHWDSTRCIHSERCTRGLSTVFDRAARPWVDVDAASADDVARVIDTCPSGALSYTRIDGVANGRRGRAENEDPAAPAAADVHVSSASSDGHRTMVTITPQANGPLSVQGQIALTNADGTIETMTSVQLCRCGQSGSKPYCDGSHARVRFVAPGVSFEGLYDA